MRRTVFSVARKEPVFRTIKMAAYDANVAMAIRENPAVSLDVTLFYYFTRTIL